MNVLLVEDHHDMAKMSAEFLRKFHGHEVHIAANGEEALAAVESFQPDLVLLDLHLPDMHGYELARKLRAQPRFANIILVALTGFGVTGDAEKSAAAGIDAHFRKPMDFGLLATLKRNPLAQVQPGSKSPHPAGTVPPPA